jgi:hypothetical protein
MSSIKNEPLRDGHELYNHVLEWLRANGIKPENIPPDPTMTLDGDQLTTDVWMLGENGQRLVAPGEDALQRTVATFAVTVPPPADVAEWLRPRCPACGR